VTETFTLHADVDTLSGVASRRITVLEVRSMPGPLTGDGGVTFEQQSEYPVVGGVVDIVLPQDADPPGYAFVVRAPQLDMTWVVPPPDDPDVTVNLSDYNTDVGQWHDDIAAAFLGYDHQTVVGSVAVIDGAIGVHALTLTMDATLTIENGANGKRTWLYVIPNGKALIYGSSMWVRDDPYLVIFVHAEGAWRPFLQEPASGVPPLALLGTGVSIDGDGRPYYDPADAEFSVFYDEDGQPYFATGFGGIPVLQDIDAVPYLTIGN
jgi:hypothetical protein